MNLKVFMFSKMNPELNSIGFEEEFHCEEIKPRLFRISHNGQSILGKKLYVDGVIYG